ncbi:TPA: F0F1 ATP synthase subunit gamma [Legionella pneumophila]|jgi:F-type H+-transporting ATPase subunit gamma|uniref:F-type H -transporting ATPase gamma chain n=4 Tax=Legionella TaxID=445 RepID=A0A378J7P0_9GAMM|nr:MULTISPECIES: F0F1 ATP synthase subunit gamma [Legionella]ERH41118.1 F-type H -transporting ATPase gamma chain [Legionella pneumophila str. Leg01/53]ERH44261.1 F-type H -transporting ATPase gamma chain [Legionella pneumophila str. Leg01/11]ERI46658.1 F-type H -transporting ATPase gamma chain [Legionella pneumophila str. Leg01/20]ADG24411.1 F-type H -transporting ATPase gamma chain [Legionella pneumophila 2300/99 Alcoy]AMP90246.1 ATPase [Legionella pneumophila subsp. pascullei]
MTKRTKLKEHVHTLEEIGHIMTAMKNLSFIELGKITQCLSMQDNVIKTIREVSHDFLSFYPMPPMNQQENPPLVSILIGSERGFCGSFNDNVLHQLDAHNEQHSEWEPALVLVGHKLALKMANDSRVMATIDGPNAIEEIPAVISNVLHTLERALLQRNKTWHSWQWTVLFNEEEHNQIQVKTWQPFKELDISPAPPFSVPPVLNGSKDQFFADLVEHYLLAMCYAIFYQSFFAENHQRLFHLNQALDRLENKKNALNHRLNLMRQEEITEEIQNILQSAQAIIGHEFT